MKRAKKYFGLFLLTGLIFMMSNPTVSAQNGQRKDGCRFLDEKQQEQAKVIRAKYQNDLTYFNNQLNELRAKQRTLIQLDKPSLKNLYANIEAKTELHNKIAKTRAKMHIEIRSIMTEEQRLMMGSRMGKRAMMHKGMHRRMDGKQMCGKGQGRHHMHKGYRKDECNNCGRGDHKNMNRGRDCNTCGKEGYRGKNRNANRGTCNNKGNFRNHRNGVCGAGDCRLNLTEEQTEAFKTLRINKLKTVNPLKNQLNELRAKKRTLMAAEKINNSDINKIIDNMSDIKEKIAKENIKQRVEMRKLLTEEQKLMFDKKMHHRRYHGKF